MGRRDELDGADDPTSLYEAAPAAAALPPLHVESGARYAEGPALGRGGMGEVVAAEDLHLGRPIAIKRLHLRDPDPDTVSRFVNEARLTSRLDHPGVPPVHDVALGPDGAPFFTMKRVEGRSLSDLVTAGELSRARRLEVFLKVCDTVAYAHARGVLHRDLKPGNVMVGAFGEVWVLDWGLARDPEPAGFAPHTDPRAVLGTPAFMPPEQARGALDELDARSDGYALGAMLYTLLTGRLPFLGDGARILRELRDGATVPRPSASAAVPWELDAIVARATAPRPEDRYPTVAGLAADVRAFLEERPLEGVRTPPLRRAARWASRHRRALAAAAVAVTVAGALVTASLALDLWVVRASWDEAARHEEDARRALVEARIALARAQAEAGRPLEAEATLREAAAVGVGDPGAIAVNRAVLRWRHPPPDLSFDATCDRTLAFRPDGERLLTASTSRIEVRAWPEGSVVLAAEPDGAVLGAVPLGDGARALVWTPGEYRVVDLPGDRVVRAFPGPDAPVERDRAVWSADGRVVVLSDPAGGARSVRVDDGAPAGPPLPGAVVERISADGTTLLGEVPGGLHRAGAERVVWDVATGAERATLPNTGTAALARDGGAIAWAADGRLVVRELATGAVRFEVPAPEGRVSFLDADRAVAVAGRDQTLSVFDAASGRPRAQVPLPAAPSASLGTATAAADAPVAAASSSGVVQAVSVPPARAPGPAALAALTALDVSPDGALLAVGARGDARVRVLDRVTGVVLRELRVGDAGVRDVRWFPDGRRVVAAGRDGVVWALDAATGAVAWTSILAEGGMVSAAVPWRDEVVAVREDGLVARLDGATGARLGELPTTARTPWSAEVSADGRWLAVTGRGHTDPLVTLHDLRDGGVRVLGAGSAYRSAFSPDGSFLLVGTGSGRPERVALPGAERESLPARGDSVQAVAIAPDASLLAVGTYDGRLELLTPAGATVASVRVHPASIVDLAFVPGTRVVVTAAGDGTARWLDLDGAGAPGAATDPATRWRALALAALLRGDPDEARRRLERAGDGDPLLALRIAAASGDRPAAAALLGSIDQGLSVGSSAVWRGWVEAGGSR
jgi:WD40 repeat protein